MEAVVLEDVRKTYGDHTAVADLSLRIPQGKIYGFIGPNGAGKTTTIRMIMNILLPDRGRIAVLGEDAGDRVKDRVGYLPEERGMYRKMKVHDVILFYGRMKGGRRRDLEPRIDAWLERLGLSEWKNKKVEELSKGMAQKVQFISTLVHDPELVILDEPFSGLDPVSTEALTEVVQGLRDSGKTVIFSTHVMEQAEKLCDAVFMIFRGRKVLDGPLEDIRRQFAEDTIDLTGEGDLPALRAAPGVRAVRTRGTGGEVFLAPGADPQEVLRALLPHYRVRSFALRSPTLHDIFLRVAGSEADREGQA